MLRLLCCAFLVLLVCCTVDAAAGDNRSPSKDVPKFVLNLDEHPLQRWTQISKHFRSIHDELIAILKKIIGAPWRVKLVVGLAEVFHGSMRQPYKDEITGLAADMNVTVGDVVVMNLLYSLTANRRGGHNMCTSIVAVDRHGAVIHGRNLDYQFGHMLRKATLSVEFHKSGQPVYTMTGFFGQVGFFTAVKPNAFTVTLDERHTGEWWMVLVELLKDGKNANVPSFLIRDVIDQETTYDAAITRLRTSHQLASSYYIVGGLQTGEGAIVTHARWTTPDVMFLNQTEDKWFLVETNYDHWTTPPSGDDRRDVAIKSMRGVGKENITMATLFKVLSVPPVTNHQTIYTALMSAANPGEYQAYLHELT